MNHTTQSPEFSDTLNPAEPVTRRDFLVRTLATGGFMIGGPLVGLGRHGTADAQSTTTSTGVSAWILIGSDETVTVQIASTEMGQGIMTGLAQIAADELQVDWAKVRGQHAPVDAAHGGSNASVYGRFTGGSLGIRLFAPAIKQAAANARQMLIMAAAKQFGVAASSCSVKLGVVSAMVNGSTRSLSYGSLAPSAAGIVLGANTPLDQYPRSIVGTSAKRVDIPAKVDGSAQFGIDVFMPGMLFAAVKLCPTLGGTVSSVGSKPAGVVAMVQVGATAGRAANGIAVVAATTWDAMNAARSVSVNWSLPADAAANDSNAIASRAAWLMSNATPLIAQDVSGGTAASTAKIASTYQLPFLAHAALEPLNCTVRYTPASGTAAATCEVWAPTQAPDQVRTTTIGLCPAGTVVTVVNTLVGGGFGRKFEQDFIRQAVQVGLACPGKPVKLTWSREQDFTQDQYRPMSLSRIEAGVSAAGKISAWKNRIVTPSISAQRGGNPATVDNSAVEGAIEMTYAINPLRVEYVRHDTSLPVGYWRSVGLSINTFAVECAIDELAAAIGWDPISFRLNNLADSRMSNLLSTLKTFSNWGRPGASGRAQGVAIAKGFGSYIGQVAEVSVNASSGAVTVHRVSTVIDCGSVINPDAVKAQIEGAVAQAMAATLYVQQTFVNGVAQVSNYNRYRMLKMTEMPQVDVQIIANGDPVGGVGEPGVPCVAPAIANAHARAVGQAMRRRSLPFFPGATLGGL